MYIPAKKIDAYHKDPANKDHKLNLKGQDEKELDAKLKESLNDTGDEEKKQPEEPKFTAFTGKGVKLVEDAPMVDTQSELYQILAAEYGDDPEMIQGIMMSMQASEVSSLEVPEEPVEGAENSVNI